MNLLEAACAFQEFFLLPLEDIAEALPKPSPSSKKIRDFNH